MESSKNVPSTTAQWTIDPRKGFDGLVYHENAPMPQLDDFSCMIKLEAASLNYRDIAIPSGKYPLAFKNNLIPLSDGAGTIVAIGDQVRQFTVGDRVCPLFHQGWQTGELTPEIRTTSLGNVNDGTLRQYAVFRETGLVPMPNNLDFAQASTLPCAGLTAWNALYGVDGRQLKKGDSVLTQGTGSVSLFAVQFALAQGAMVIATTSSDEKAELLHRLGVEHVINYRKDPNWGETAKKLTPDGEGVHHVIEVGGNQTIKQSFKALRMGGVITVIGFLGEQEHSQSPITVQDFLSTLAIVRGVSVGSREQFLAMNKFVSTHGIKPIIDNRMFTLQDARAAYEYLESQKHQGKVVIRIS